MMPGKILHFTLIFSLLTGYLPITLAQTYCGGQVTAELVSLQTLTYNITVTLYATRRGDLVYSKQEIYFGHGEAVELITDDHEFERSCNADSLFCIEKYRMTHTFPGYGEYRIGYRKYNRAFKVSNLRNSINTPIFLETKLTIDPGIGSNSTPLPADTFAFQTHILTRFVHPVQAKDPDGDSLTYELVIPSQNKDTLVEGYRFPDEFDVFYFKNPIREDGSTPPLLTVEGGNVIWDAPNYRGIFTIALKIHEWRNVQGVWTSLGYVTREMDIYVQDTTIITSTENEMPNNKIQLFPNPTSGQFRLILPDERWVGGQTTIYNLLGQNIYQNTMQSSTQHFDLYAEPSGLYFLVLQKNNRHQVLRLVIQK